MPNSWCFLLPFLLGIDYFPNGFILVVYVFLDHLTNNVFSIIFNNAFALLVFVSSHRPLPIGCNFGAQFWRQIFPGSSWSPIRCLGQRPLCCQLVLSPDQGSNCATPVLLLGAVQKLYHAPRGGGGSANE